MAGATRPFEMREAMLIAFCAVFLVGSRAALRWHLHLPGHSMLPAAFGLVLVRSCVDRRSAGTACGALAGLACAALGLGKGGPIIVLKLLLPGLVVDGLTPRGPGDRATLSLARGAVIGALAGAVGFVPLVLVEWLASVDPLLIALHALAAAGTKAGFGALGGAAGAWVTRELRHHGVLERSA